MALGADDGTGDGTGDGTDGVVAAASAALGVELHVVEELGGSRRTDVRRVTDGERSLVVKAYRSTEGHTWARESAALEALAGGPVPELVAVHDDPRLVVMADLGRHESVADALMADDPAAARDAVLAWSRGLAGLHAAGARAVDGFAAALAERAAEQPVHDLPGALATAAANYTRLLPGLEDEAADGLTALTDLPALLDDAALVVSPGDTCPDNNLRRPDGLVFLDLEWAETRAAAWDLAYLRVPWPTCWCAWLLPDELADEAVAAYRGAGVPGQPVVSDRELAVVTVGWCLLSSAMFLEAALQEHGGNTDTPRMPGRRTMILHRLRAASRVEDDTSGLADLAGAVLDRVAPEWGEHAPRLAPAFR